MQQIAPQQDCSAARLQRSKDAHDAWAYARSALQHISRAELLQLQAVFQSELHSSGWKNEFI